MLVSVTDEEQKFSFHLFGVTMLSMH